MTGLLNQGDNVLGAIVAHGWYAGFYGFDPKRAGAHYGTAPELLAQLVLQLADGSEQRIVTDGQWESSTGAIRHADLLMGERHDLALEPSGWDMPGLDTRDWRLVQVRERDATELVADPGPPIRVTEEIAPRSIATDDYGRHIVDFGQNLTGWLRINVDGSPGEYVRIRHGEVLAADGSLYADNLTLTGAGAPAWGDAGVIVPRTMWKMYGDTAVLDRHFGAMTRWMDFLERANPDYLRARELGNSYNDWLAPCDDDTPHELLATAYWAHDAALMAEIADATGRPDDAAGYRALWSKIRSAFTDAFVAADGKVTSGTQTAYALGLHMKLVPDDLRAAAADHLVAAIRAADWHMTTGFAGVGYLLPVLSSTGHTAAAYSPCGLDRVPLGGLRRADA